MHTFALLAPWGVNDINELLRPQPLRLEMGLTRSTDGLLTVAIRTDLHGCKGRMLDWWFTFFETTQHIRWWHPHDHVEHRGWDHHWKRGERYVGASIDAVEWLAELPPVAARLKFHAAEEVFAPQPLHEARETQALSAPASALAIRWRWMSRVHRWMARCCTWRAILLMAACCAAASCWARPAPIHMMRCRTRSASI